MKLAYCTQCSDFVAPYRDSGPQARWRWCVCDHMAVRWANSSRGHLEVTAMHGRDHVRIIGLSNLFLLKAVSGLPVGDDPDEDWRVFHALVAEETPDHYLFSERRRECWAVVFRVGDTGDVKFIDYTDVPHHLRAASR